LALPLTGHGEEVIRITGCHLVVELMRQGNSMQKKQSCIVNLTQKRNKNLKDIQVL
jgi:N4-(beta-N-acetylglucosaminyl)-L-asparaginase